MTSGASEPTLSPARARVFVVVLLVVGIGAGLVLSEGAIRVVRRFVCMPSVPKLFRPDPVVGWTHKPSASARLHGCIGKTFEWRAVTHINSTGLRDREHAYERRPGVARVLLLGDSFTEGLQVAMERTFAARIEASFAAHGVAVEVVNAGFSGFGTDNELLFFRTEGRRYRPDLVVLMFTTSNDVIENARALHGRMYAEVAEGAPPKAYFRLRADGSLVLDDRAPRRHWQEDQARRATWAGRVWDRLVSELHLVRMLDARGTRSAPPHAVARTARTARATALGIYRTRPTAQWDRAWTLTRALVRELDREVRAEGAAFAVAVIPANVAVSMPAWKWQLALSPELPARRFDREWPTTRIVSLLEQERIAHVSLLPAMRAHLETTGRSGYFFWDGHFDEEGHGVVAAELTRFIAAQLGVRVPD